MSERWQTLGQATSEAIEEIKKLGLPETAARAAHEIIWKVATWQGDRERRKGRIALAEQVGRLAHDGQ